MNGFNVINVGLITAGAILIYAGIKNQTPYALLQELFIQSKSKEKFTVENSAPLQDADDEDAPN